MVYNWQRYEGLKVLPIPIQFWQNLEYLSQFYINLDDLWFILKG